MFQRHDHLLCLGTERLESVVAVERFGRFVFGVDHQCEHGDLGSRSAHGGVREKCASKLPALQGLIHRQAPDPCHWNRRVSRHFLGERRRQFRERHPAGRQGVVAGNLAAADFDGDIAAADSASNVLGGLAGQTAIERCDAAREPSRAWPGPNTSTRKGAVTLRWRAIDCAP